MSVIFLCFNLIIIASSGVDMNNQAGGYMTKEIITISADAAVEQALMAMKNHHFRHLPVIDDKTKDIIGIVSDRDLYKALSSDEVKVGHVVSHPVYKFDVATSIKEIVDAMIKNKISAFLLTKNSEVKGIITSEDLLVILSHALSDEMKQRPFIDNYLEYTNQLTGAVFNPNLII